MSNFDFLVTDMHAHWLPGIDDGARTMEDSLEMLRWYVKLGYKKLVATPHIITEFYPNTPDIINGVLDKVRLAAAEANIDLELHAAAEYLIDDTFESHRDEHQLLLIPGTKNVLIEFGFYSPPLNLGEVIFKLQASGFRPIIAHPERYSYYHTDLSPLRQFHARGLQLQVNLLSLEGHYGKSVKQVATQLIREGYVDYLGSDAHTALHLEKMSMMMNDRKIASLLQNATFRNSELFHEND